MKYVGALFFNLWKLYIGIVFAIFLLLFYPFMFLCIKVRAWQKHAFKISVLWSYCMRIFCFYAVRVEGKKDIPEGPYIICANHTSYLDIFLMYSILPEHKFLFLGKSEILSYPLVKTFFKSYNIPVFRKDRMKAAKSFIECKKAVDKGWSLAIFPEGGIPDENLPHMMEFKDGAFQLAKKCKAPIVNLTFINNYKLFSDPDHIFSPSGPGLSRVKFHPTISKEEVEKLSVEELKLKVRAQIESAIEV